jgi:hypothetical protein
LLNKPSKFWIFIKKEILFIFMHKRLYLVPIYIRYKFQISIKFGCFEKFRQIL